MKYDLDGFSYFLGDLSESTVNSYKGIIRRFLDFTNKDLAEITLNDYGKYSNSISNATSSYKILVYSALKRFSKYLFANQISSTDYMEFVERPRFRETIKTKKRREKSVLEPDEVKALKESIINGIGSSKAKSYQKHLKERDLAIFMVFMSTGIRCSALHNLDIDNINYDEKSLLVIDKGSKIKEYILSESSWNALQNWLGKRSEIAKKDEKALFVTKYGDRISNKSIYNMIKKYAQVIKGKDISPHKLRATYGTQLLNATGDIYLVKECMNHSRISTTMLYIRNNENTTKKASEIMNGLIS